MAGYGDCFHTPCHAKSRVGLDDFLEVFFLTRSGNGGEAGERTRITMPNRSLFLPPIKAPSAFLACLHHSLSTLTIFLLGTVAMAQSTDEVSLKVKVSAYTQPDNNPINSGTTFSFPTTAVGESVSMSFRLQSEKLGLVRMLNAGFDSSIGDWTEFRVAGLAVGVNGTTVPSNTGSGEGLFFTVTFKPNYAGAKTGALKIRTDQSTLSYVINFTGSATRPTMQWEEPVGVGRNDNSPTVVFPLTFIGTGTPSKVIGIRNTGNGAATGAAVSITGADASSFSFTPLTGTTINGGETKTVTVTFNPTTPGNKSAQINFTRDNVFSGGGLSSLILSGSALTPGPEIVVEEPSGTNRNSGDVLAFGEGFAGQDTFTKTITIKNIGNQTLSGLSRALSGTNASEFSVSALTAGTTIATNASISLQVSFTPTSAGSKSALLRIPSNDADENPFELNLKGSAIALVASTARTGVAVAATGQAVPGVSGATYTDFFQVHTNTNGECAFYATTNTNGMVLMSNGGLGRMALPVKVLAAGDDPAGGGGAISQFKLLRLQSSGTVNSVVVRGPATATQPVTAVFRGNAQLVKVGDTPPRPLVQAFSSIGAIKTFTAALDEGAGAIIADFDATPTATSKSQRFTNIYNFTSSGGLVTQRVSYLLDTTFLTLAPAPANANSIAYNYSSLWTTLPGTKDSLTVLLFGDVSQQNAIGPIPPMSVSDVLGGESRKGNTFYHCILPASTGSTGSGRALVKGDLPGSAAINVISGLSWRGPTGPSIATTTATQPNTIGNAAISNAGSIFFEATQDTGARFVGRTARNYYAAAADGKDLIVEGANAPGIDGYTISKIFYLDNSFNISPNGSKCVIHAAIVPNRGQKVEKELLYYVVEGTDTPVPIAIAGDTIPVGTGTKTITGFDVQGVWNKRIAIGPKPINDAGQVAALVKCGTDRVAFVFNAPQ